MFDRVVVVDWSAACRPKRGHDSIWMCQADTSRGACDAPVNSPTRAEAERQLAEWLQPPGRVLVGFDFPFGYPTGTAAALGLGGKAWRAMWDHLASEVQDDTRNVNNRFEVADRLNGRMGTQQFWGTPHRSTDWLTRTRPSADRRPLPEHRAAEQRLRDRGLRPFTVWQLLGAGSVGSQAITGIPVVDRLRGAAGERGSVWPFETGLTLDPRRHGDAVVFAEVWPSAIPFGHVDHAVKDARQVVALADHLIDLDANGSLGVLFSPAVDGDTARHVVDEEGWVLLVP